MKTFLSILSISLIFLTLSFCSKNSEPESEVQPPTASVSADDVISMDKLTKKPTIIKQALPEYPEAARKAGIEGRAVVQITILEDGSVSDAKILQSSGNEALDKSALTATKDFKFSPGMVEDKAVKTRVAVPIQFTLDEKK
jgi:protein TonB